MKRSGKIAEMPPEEDPEDREMRLAGEAYAKECGAAFVAAHATELGKLVTLYSDKAAEDLWWKLRDKFWSDDRAQPKTRAAVPRPGEKP